MRRITFAAGFGAGYVLGARAGRARYEQIIKLVRRVANKPAVQDATEELKTQAGGILNTAKRVVTSKVGGQQVETSPTSAGDGTINLRV
ncbi:MAG: hypothetical protein ABR520_07810 [Mycobacteriales bacterium]|nr:hypothetical protein [Frankia sp.]